MFGKVGLRDGKVGVEDAWWGVENLALAGWWGGGSNGVFGDEKLKRSSQKNNPFHIFSNSRSEKGRPEVK